MPIKRRTRAYELTSQVRIAAGSPWVSSWERLWGGPAEGRRAWAALGSHLTRFRGDRPEAWWSYTPGVPDKLRDPPEIPDPRELLTGLASNTYTTASRARHDHERARLEWLLTSGHCEPDEQVHIQRYLRRFEGSDPGPKGSPEGLPFTG